MRTHALALLLLLPAGASACAAILNIQEFEGPTDADVDATGATDATRDGFAGATDGAPADGGDARPGLDGKAADRQGQGDAPREAGARDGSNAADRSVADGDAADGAEEAPACPSGFHECADGCASNTSTYACGASCEPCPSPLSAVSIGCDGISCSASCGNLTLCEGGAAGICSDTTSDPDNCGSCGTVCPSPRTHGTRVCSGMPPSCSFDCSDGGRTACPAASPTDCVDTTSDIRNCGACGVVCPATGDGATRRCVDGGCQ